jgi:chromosome segregation ATPase
MDSDSTMSQSERISKLRRRRGVLLGRLKHVDSQIDEWEQAGAIDQGFITSCRRTIDDLGNKINNIQDELDELEDPETKRAEATQYEHIRIRGRIMELVEQTQSVTHPTSSITPMPSHDPRGSLATCHPNVT